MDIFTASLRNMCRYLNYNALALIEPSETNTDILKEKLFLLKGDLISQFSKKYIREIKNVSTKSVQISGAEGVKTIYEASTLDDNFIAPKSTPL